MPEIINHVPNAQEATEWAALRGSEQTAAVTAPSLEELAGTFHQYLNEFSAAPIYSAWEQYQSVEDPAKATGIHEVLARGTYKGQELGLPEASRSAADAAIDRVWFARMINEKPETVDILAEKKVAGFHVSGSYALAGVLEGGKLLSGIAMEAEGLHTPTGQRDIGQAQSSISFGTVPKLKRNFQSWNRTPNVTRTNEDVVADLQGQIKEAEMNLQSAEQGSRAYYLYESGKKHAAGVLEDFKKDPNSLRATMLRHQFPVAFGVSRDFVRQAEAQREGGRFFGVEDYGEFRPAAEAIPVEALTVVAVPADKVASVTELLKHFGREHTAVVAFEDFQGDTIAA